MEQWVQAIMGQIKLSKDNKRLSDLNQQVVKEEKALADHDKLLVQKIFKYKNAIFNPVQPYLLDFCGDPNMS